MSNFIDRTGEKFGRLTIIGLDKNRNKIEKERYKKGEISRPTIYWLCECNCKEHNIVSVQYSNLVKKNNATKSCGCLFKEVAGKHSIKHNTFDFLNNDIIKGWDTNHKNFFLIDKIDYDIVKKYCWRKDRYGYWVTTLNKERKILKMHQLIMKQIDKTYIPSRKNVPDHITKTITESKKDDNRRTNLRLVSQKENNRNIELKSNNKSGKTGVYFHKQSQKWTATIYNDNGKQLCKRFKKIEDAIEQRQKWEIEFKYVENDIEKLREEWEGTIQREFED